MKRPSVPRRTTAAVCVASVATLLLSACGASVEPAAQSNADVTLENCGVESTYPRPERPVAYDVSAIEKMFSLGLADQMHGIVMPETVSSVIPGSPYRDDYSKVETISDGILGQELLVSSKADWVFAGWQAGFSEERGITPQSLEKVGINSFMQNETCFGYGENGTSPEPIQAMYQDLADLGTVFGVEERAENLVGDLKQRQGELEGAERPEDPAKVFVYDSGTSEPYTTGKRTALNSMIELAGATSVTDDVDARFTTVGWESVVDSDPEVIVIIDYNKQPSQEKIDYLKKQSPVKDSPAVKNDRIYVMDYGEAVSSPRNIEGAAKLASYLRGQGL